MIQAWEFSAADAGYDEAMENAKKWDIKIPMMKK